jgi:cell division protein FtsQ
MVSILIIMVVLLLFVWSRMNFTGNSRIISNVEIEIENPIKDFQFLNNQEVSERIQTAVGNPIGKATSEVSLTQLEEVINAYPEVKSVRAYVSFSGRLHIRIKERRAIAQLINIKGDVCYLDSSMRMIPAKKNQQAPVIILNGHINQKIALGKKINAQWQAKLKDLLIFINQNSFWENHFEQCYVDKFSQLMLYPNIGRHSIVMNNVENIDEKFENLRLFYDKGLKHMGWDHYRSINISYRNQIVTTRNVSNTEHN